MNIETIDPLQRALDDARRASQDARTVLKAKADDLDAAHGLKNQASNELKILNDNRRVLDDEIGARLAAHIAGRESEPFDFDVPDDLSGAITECARRVSICTVASAAADKAHAESLEHLARCQKAENEAIDALRMREAIDTAAKVRAAHAALLITGEKLRSICGTGMNVSVAASKRQFPAEVLEALKLLPTIGDINTPVHKLRGLNRAADAWEEARLALIAEGNAAK